MNINEECLLNFLKNPYELSILSDILSENIEEFFSDDKKPVNFVRSQAV